MDVYTYMYTFLGTVFQIFIYQTYSGFSMTSIMVAVRCSSVSSCQCTISPMPWFFTFSAFFFWSTNIGIPTMGVPWYTASWNPRRPQWEMNTFTFLCAIGNSNFIIKLWDISLKMSRTGEKTGWSLIFRWALKKFKLLEISLYEIATHPKYLAEASTC